MRPATGQILEREGKRGKVYAIRYQSGGKRRYKTLGRESEGWTWELAQEALQEALRVVPPMGLPVSISVSEETYRLLNERCGDFKTPDQVIRECLASEGND